MSEQTVDALLDKLRQPPLTELTTSEQNALLGIVETWAHLMEVAATRSSSMRDIRRLLGIRLQDESSEPPASSKAPCDSSTKPDADEHGAAPDQADSDTEQPRTEEPAPELPAKKNRHEHGRRGPGDFGRLAEAHHVHTSLAIGDPCPGCARGRIYKYRPDEFTTISGQSPLVATRHIVDALQCNLCKAVFKAPIPEVLVDDGIEERPLYTYSAVAMVAIYRFFAGVPMHRQDRLQKALGVHVPDSSIWDMCERLANVLQPIVRVLHEIAKDAPLFYGDDTGATILDTRVKVRKNRKTGADDVRTGCHTTCIIAVTADDHAITLFVTGIHHTGEVMDLVLCEREPLLAPPVFMGDCIASNTVTKTAVLYAGCNAHGVRKFKDLADRYPDEAGYVLDRYKTIFENDATCRTRGLVGEPRRDFHREHSRPLLREICEHGADLIEQKKVEPNSDLGAAFQYLIDHERRLSAFARHPFAPLDNNRCERELKVCIRLRDTARFFRNAIGAGVADAILTVGATALAANVTLPDYFTAAQRHAADVREHPELWLPWRYHERVLELQRSRLSPPDG